MGDGHAPAGFANGIVAILVIRVGHEHVPLTVDHVRVEVVWSAGVVDVVPRIHPRWICFVRYVNERDADLSGVAPLPDVRVGITGVNQLILLNDVFATVVFEVLHVEHLRVRVVVYASDGCVVRVRHVHDVHVVPTSEVGVRSAVGGGGDLDLCVTWSGQGIEVEKFHVVGSEFMLTCVFVVVSLALNQWIARLHGRVFARGRLNVIAEDQQRC